MIVSARRERVLLIAILALAFCLRVWGIGFGLPNEHARPDERHLIGFTLTMGGNRLNPGFFNYPSFYLYVLLSLYVGYFVLGRLSGHFHSSKDLVAEYAIAPDAFYLIDRLLVAALSTATVFLVYRIVQRAVGARAALLSSFLLAVCYLHVRDSHFGTVDVPLTFMCTLAVFLMQRAVDSPSLKANGLAALCTGLAISTKYNAIVLGAPLALMLVQQARARSSAGLAPWLVRAMLACGLLVVVGFVLGTPYSLLDHRTFVRDVVSELVDKGRTKPPIDLGPGFVYHAWFTLPHGVGWPMLLAAVLGAIGALRADFKRASLLLAFPLAWYAAVGQSHYIFVRYVVPLAPSICIFAAWGVELVLRRLEGAERKGSSWQGVVVATTLVAVVAAPCALNTLQWDRLISGTDTRVLAAEWFEQHIQSGARVGLVGPQYIRPDLWSSVEQMRGASNAGSTGQGRGLRNELRIAHLEKTGKPGYQLLTYQQDHWQDALRPDEPSPHAPRYVVIAEHPAWVANVGDVPKLEAGYRRVASFIAYDAAAAANVAIDRHDAVYAPLAHFGGVERPGPNIVVYERSEPEPQ